MICGFTCVKIHCLENLPVNQIKYVLPILMQRGSVLLPLVLSDIPYDLRADLAGKCMLCIPYSMPGIVADNYNAVICQSACLTTVCVNKELCLLLCVELKYLFCLKYS